MDIIFFCIAIQVILILEDRWQEYFKRHQYDKRIYAIFDIMGHWRTIPPKPSMGRERETIN